MCFSFLSFFFFFCSFFFLLCPKQARTQPKRTSYLVPRTSYLVPRTSYFVLVPRSLSYSSFFFLLMFCLLLLIIISFLFLLLLLLIFLFFLFSFSFSFFISFFFYYFLYSSCYLSSSFFFLVLNIIINRRLTFSYIEWWIQNVSTYELLLFMYFKLSCIQQNVFHWVFHFSNYTLLSSFLLICSVELHWYVSFCQSNFRLSARVITRMVLTNREPCVFICYVKFVLAVFPCHDFLQSFCGWQELLLATNPLTNREPEWY